MHQAQDRAANVVGPGRANHRLVQRAFDEDPPLLTSSWGGDANTDVTLYDVIGRRYFLGMRANF